MKKGAAMDALQELWSGKLVVFWMAIAFFNGAAFDGDFGSWVSVATLIAGAFFAARSYGIMSRFLFKRGH